MGDVDALIVVYYADHLESLCAANRQRMYSAGPFLITKSNETYNALISDSASWLAVSTQLVTSSSSTQRLLRFP